MIKFPIVRRVALLLAASSLAACGPLKLGKGLKKIVMEDFAEGRVVDVSITEKVSGNREMLFLSMPKKTKFLEGYIQGVITDYQDNPVAGVVVRAAAVGEAGAEEKGPTPLTGSSFDPGVSDSNGFYRIRFSLPILDHAVDIRGRLQYSPGWEQERDNLGKAYEPQIKQSQFRLYFEEKRGRLTFTEGIRKTIVQPIGGGAGKAAPAPSLPGFKGQAAPTAALSPGAPEKSVEKPGGAKSEDDIFKGFGFGE